MPLAPSTPPSERDSIIMRCLYSKAVDELTAVNTLRIDTSIHDALLFQMTSFDGFQVFATIHYENGMITVGPSRLSRDRTPRTTSELIAVDYEKSGCSILNIGDPSFSIDDIITYLKLGIEYADKELTCDPVQALHAHIVKNGKKRRCFKRSNCQGQRIDLRLEKNKIVAGVFGFPDIAATISLEDNIFVIKSDHSETMRYALVKNGFTTKYSIASAFYEVLQVWFDNHILKATGQKQGYHRGRSR